jgi:hypothetical protein
MPAPKWTFNVDGAYAVLYKDGVVDWRMGPWDIVGNPDGPGRWAEEVCNYRNENPDWDAPKPVPEETPE